MPKAPEKIIVSRTDSIGDVMLTLPLAGVLKQHFPSCHILFLGRKYTRPVIECCTHADQFLDWDEISEQPPAEQKRALSSVGADTIIHVFPNRKVAFAARAAAIPLRIGTSHRIYHWTTCNSRPSFTRRRSGLHEAQLNLRLLSPLGIPTEYPLGELWNYYGFGKIKPLPGHLLSLIDPSRFNLLLHPRSKGSAREWGLNNFSRLADILPLERFKLFITGTREEGESLGPLKQKHNVCDLTGKLSLDELIAFICAADGLVSASTGPLHIAAALGKKAIGIYAPMRPIHPGRWMPLGSKASYLVLDKSCSACRKNHDCACIRSIDPEQVKAELLRA
ncbi:MAG: glycosyltransferase family 9 protein [Bacteroidota bacterium]